MMILDMTTVDTTPGAGGAMAPPTGYGGMPDAYKALMRDRYRNNPDYRQHMLVFARRIYDVEITGPYAEEARNVLGKIGA